MDWQQIAALAIVAVTAALLVRSQVRRSRRGMPRACNGCRCGTIVESETPEAHSKGGLH